MEGRSEEGILCMRGRAEEIEGREAAKRDKWRYLNIYESLGRLAIIFLSGDRVVLA